MLPAKGNCMSQGGTQPYKFWVSFTRSFKLTLELAMAKQAKAGKVLRKPYVRMRPTAIALNYSVKDIGHDTTYDR